ncbi:MAG TPA: hypothetical protein VEC16_03390, partial [Alphaproteobacteria bacterium]|nr:hypothetical protein [Alphaproteobacteria bacterium]
VVLAAIGALSYFGVLNPSRFTPDTCLASAPFSCPGKPTTTASGSTVFSLINGQGYSVLLTGNGANAGAVLSGSLAGCTVTSLCAQGVPYCTNTTATVPAGQGISINLSNCPFTNLNIVKGDIVFNYTNPESRLNEQILVSITSKPR